MLFKRDFKIIKTFNNESFNFNINKERSEIQ